MRRKTIEANVRDGYDPTTLCIAALRRDFGGARICGFERGEDLKTYAKQVRRIIRPSTGIIVSISLNRYSPSYSTVRVGYNKL